MNGKVILGIIAVAALGAAFFLGKKEDRPGQEPTAPPPGGLPPGVSPEAERVDYAGHAIYVWEVLSPEPELAFQHWTWIVADPIGLPVQSGQIMLEGLAGAAAATSAAKAWIDTKYVVPDSGGAGGAGG